MVTAGLLDQLRIGSNSGDNRSLTRAKSSACSRRLPNAAMTPGRRTALAGPRVRGAICSYQTDASLPVTGDARYSLLAKLEMDGDETTDDNIQGNNGGNSASHVQQVEGELQRRGYYVGEFDGEADDQYADGNSRLSERCQPARDGRGERRAARKPEDVFGAQPRLYQLSASVGGREPAGSPWLCRRKRSTAISTTRHAAPSRSTKTRRACRGDNQLNFALLDHIERSNQSNDTQTASKLIWSVETELTQRGYKTGPIDGTMDPQTVAAISDYQGDCRPDCERSMPARICSPALRTRMSATLRRRTSAISNAGSTAAATRWVRSTALPMRRQGPRSKSYQGDAGLVVTGRPSIALRDHLRSSNTVSGSYVRPANPWTTSSTASARHSNRSIESDLRRRPLA